MNEFTLLSQKDVNTHCQGVNVSEFSFSNKDNLSERKLINNFIHSKYFIEESRREVIKNFTGEGSFLRQLFEIDFVKLSDFKTINKKELIEFLDNFDELNHPFDKNIFNGLKTSFLESLKNTNSGKFYLISRKWFNRSDKRIRQIEYDCYDYYFLIIWTDETNKILTVSEWTFD